MDVDSLYILFNIYMSSYLISYLTKLNINKVNK